MMPETYFQMLQRKIKQINMAKMLKLFILSDALRGAYLTFSAYLKFFIKSKGGGMEIRAS